MQSVRRLDIVAHTGKLAVQFLVSVFLIFQTAHQSAADSGDLRRIQGQILLLRHLDGYRYEIRQIAVAAQRPSTDADTTADLCLITDTNLTQLDTSLEHTCQILYQFAEVDTSIRRKIEQHLVIIKRILRIDQLHFQTVL